MRGNHTLMFLSLSFSLSLPYTVLYSINTINKYLFNKYFIAFIILYGVRWVLDFWKDHGVKYNCLTTMFYT